MIVVKYGIAQVAVIVRGEEVRSQAQPSAVVVVHRRFFPLDDGSAGMLECVAPAADAGVEFEVGQVDHHSIWFCERLVGFDGRTDGRWETPQQRREETKRRES
jgi:hypothetical protein